MAALAFSLIPKTVYFFSLPAMYLSYNFRLDVPENAFKASGTDFLCGSFSHLTEPWHPLIPIHCSSTKCSLSPSVRLSLKTYSQYTKVQTDNHNLQMKIVTQLISYKILHLKLCKAQRHNSYCCFFRAPLVACCVKFLHLPTFTGCYSSVHSPNTFLICICGSDNV